MPSERTVRRHARAAGEPPKSRGRKPKADPRVSTTLTLHPAVRAAAELAAAAEGVSLSAYVERVLATALAL